MDFSELTVEGLSVISMADRLVPPNVLLYLTRPQVYGRGGT